MSRDCQCGDLRSVCVPCLVWLADRGNGWERVRIGRMLCAMMEVCAEPFVPEGREVPSWRAACLGLSARIHGEWADYQRHGWDLVNLLNEERAGVQS